jgi:hypothetical protein
LFGKNQPLCGGNQPISGKYQPLHIGLTSGCLPIGWFLVKLFEIQTFAECVIGKYFYDKSLPRLGLRYIQIHLSSRHGTFFAFYLTNTQAKKISIFYQTGMEALNGVLDGYFINKME